MVPSRTQASSLVLPPQVQGRKALQCWVPRMPYLGPAKIEESFSGGLLIRVDGACFAKPPFRYGIWLRGSRFHEVRG